MKPSESEILSILEAHKDAPIVNPNKVYPPLPPAENIMPLMRIPEQMTLCEKIGGTEYTVNAHFREDGHDLLSMLTGIFNRNISGFGYGYGDCGSYDDEY